MSGGWKLAVIVMVVAGVAGALVLKQSDGEPGWPLRSEIPYDPATPVPVEPIPPTYESTHPGLPRLVAIGAGSCIPCRAMAPIRADLRRDYAGALVVDFYDVWKDRQAGLHFGIQVIPTLIYYDGRGVELGRQEGYVRKDHILATPVWRGAPGAKLTMTGILEALSGGLAGAPAFALLASAGWGAASVLLSPCHLAGIPLIIGFAGGGDRTAPVEPGPAVSRGRWRQDGVGIGKEAPAMAGAGQEDHGD